jgi:hypothetical protein
MSVETEQRLVDLGVQIVAHYVVVVTAREEEGFAVEGQALDACGWKRKGERIKIRYVFLNETCGNIIISRENRHNI